MQNDHSLERAKGLVGKLVELARHFGVCWLVDKNLAFDPCTPSYDWIWSEHSFTKLWNHHRYTFMMVGARQSIGDPNVHLYLLLHPEHGYCLIKTTHPSTLTVVST